MNAKIRTTAKPSDSVPMALADDATHRRVIEAAISCVDRLGLEGATVDDIALESGVSRATLYRKFGNKDAILDALVAQQAGPFVSEAIRVLMGSGNIAGRIERALVLGVMSLPPQRGLDDALATAPTSAAQALFTATYRQRVRAVLHLIISSPDVRPGLEIDATLDWFLRELMALLAARPWSKRELAKRIRDFIVPVFVPDRLRESAPAAPRTEGRS